MMMWLRQAAMTMVSTCFLANAGSACEPQSPYRSALTKTLQNDVAMRLVDGSTVIADGIIVWTKKGWQAKSNGRGLAGLSIADSLPRLKPTKVYKGPYQSQYVLLDDGEQCGNGTYAMLLPPGTKVRLLLSPVKTRQGLTLWEVKDTSWSGTRKHEIQINAAIDRLLGNRRSPDSASLLYPSQPASR